MADMGACVCDQVRVCVCPRVRAHGPLSVGEERGVVTASGAGLGRGNCVRARRVRGPGSAGDVGREWVHVSARPYKACFLLHVVARRS